MTFFVGNKDAVGNIRGCERDTGQRRRENNEDEFEMNELRCTHRSRRIVATKVEEEYEDKS